MADKICIICLEKETKYTCPACGAKTCSLNCVNRHKLRSECTGKVDPAKFVPKKEITQNPSLINRDYNYLLNFERKIDLGIKDVKSNAKMMFRRQMGNNNKRQKFDGENFENRITRMKKKYNEPQYSFKRENVLVIHLPPGMSRATQNKSGYDKKAGTYAWTVEWVPVGSKGTPLSGFISYRLKEELTLKEALSLSQLAKSLGVEPENISPNSLRFGLENVLAYGKRSIISLNSDDTLCKALANKAVLEFPKIYVMSEPEIWEEYTQSEKEAYGPESDLGEDNASSTDPTSSLDSDSTSDSDSESSDDSESAPEEVSSKIEHNVSQESQGKQTEPGIVNTAPETYDDEEEGFSA